MGSRATPSRVVRRRHGVPWGALPLFPQELEAYFPGGNITRVPFGVGLASHVVTSGEPLNCPDAYKDQRFNPQIDAQRASKTQAVLCIPIKQGDTTVAVLEAINKNGVCAHPCAHPCVVRWQGVLDWGPAERSDPTQHAKGRTVDCAGPRKGTTTRRNVTQGGGGGGGLCLKERGTIGAIPEWLHRGHRGYESGWGGVTGGWKCGWGWCWGMGMPLGWSYPPSFK